MGSDTQTMVMAPGRMRMGTSIQNKQRSRTMGMLPNALLLCLFKMKFLKSLKPQNAASSFFDFDVVQKAKICLDTVDDSGSCLSARFSNGINLLDLRTRL